MVELAVLGSDGSKPAIAVSILAASSTVFPCGPNTSRVDPDSGTPPVVGTRPNVVFTPTSPLAPAGFWIDPPVSSAVPSVAKLALTLTAVPLLLPPGARPTLYALSVGPKVLLFALAPLRANTGKLVLPKMMAPAVRILATIGASF